MARARRAGAGARARVPGPAPGTGPWSNVAVKRCQKSGVGWPGTLHQTRAFEAVPPQWIWTATYFQKGCLHVLIADAYFGSRLGVFWKYDSYLLLVDRLFVFQVPYSWWKSSLFYLHGPIFLMNFSNKNKVFLSHPMSICELFLIKIGF